MQRSFIFQWSQLQRRAAGMEETARHAPGAPPWTPNTDVFESPDGVIVRIEIAGVPSEAIELWVDEQALAVRGVRRDPQCAETAAGYRYRQMEMDFGPFERVVQLPFAVDGANAHATLQQGVLTVRLPRAPAARAIHARIQLGSAP